MSAVAASPATDPTPIFSLSPKEGLLPTLAYAFESSSSQLLKAPGAADNNGREESGDVLHHSRLHEATVMLPPATAPVSSPCDESDSSPDSQAYSDAPQCSKLSAATDDAQLFETDTGEGSVTSSADEGVSCSRGGAPESCYDSARNGSAGVGGGGGGDEDSVAAEAAAALPCPKDTKCSSGGDRQHRISKRSIDNNTTPVSDALDVVQPACVAPVTVIEQQPHTEVDQRNLDHPVPLSSCTTPQTLLMPESSSTATAIRGVISRRHTSSSGVETPAKGSTTTAVSPVESKLYGPRSGDSEDACGVPDELNQWWRNPHDHLFLSQPPPHFSLSRSDVLEDFRGKKLYLFLDYDGTLTPIVNNPWEARLSPAMRDLLYKLAADSSNLVTVGIVTGRALTCVKNFVQITASERLNFIYAASHGFHIEAAGKMLHHKVGSRFIPILKDAAGEIAAALNHIPGVALEDNEFAVSVHYRNAPEGSEAEVEQFVRRILQRYPALKMTRGKMVLELRINVVWDKGRAVFWLLNAMRVDPFEKETRVIYVGDDLTDEDAFRAVRQFNNSLTVLVSDTPASRPTAAAYFVNDPDEVAGLLRDFLKVTHSSGNEHLSA